MAQDGIDTRALAWGIVLSGVVSVGFATALLYLARTHDDPRVGPTAASLDDGPSTFFGAALGLALGVAGAVAARHPPERHGRRRDAVDRLGLGILVIVVVTVASACGAGAEHVLRGRRA